MGEYEAAILDNGPEKTKIHGRTLVKIDPVWGNR